MKCPGCGGTRTRPKLIGPNPHLADPRQRRRVRCPLAFHFSHALRRVIEATRGRA